MKIKHKPTFTERQATQFALREFECCRSFLKEGVPERAVIASAAATRIVMLRVMLRSV